MSDNLLGHEVLSAIIQQGYTLKEVAQAIEISQSYLTDITKSRRTPSDNVLDKLIKHLNINRNYAYYLVNKYPPELRSKDMNLLVLDKALNWIINPNKYTLRKTEK